MTDRIKGFTISLDNDIRIDEMEHIINAIKMIKGVVDVKPIVADSFNDMIVRGRCENEFRHKLYKLIEEL